MRIQGVHLRGLRIPPGEQQLGFDAGYNVVATGAAGPALLRVLLSLLYPELLPPQPQLREAAGAARSRAILGLADRGGNYRVVADLGRARVALARYDVSGRRYDRVAVDAVGVSERLRALGLPELRDFLELNTAGWPAAEPAVIGPEPAPGVPRAVPRTPGPEATAGAGSVASLGAEDEQGAAAAVPEDFDLDEAKRLAAQRERVWGVEQELGHLRRALAETAWLARLAAAPEFERRLARLKALQEAHAQERAAQELARRELLDERARLSGRSPALRPFGLGLALGTALVLAVAAATASGLRELAPYAALGAGLLWAGVLALHASALRRRLGAVDGRLVGMRLGEGSRGSVPAELQELARVLSERRLAAEELRQQLAAQRQQERRCTELEAELTEARRALTPERLRWLEDCERAITARARARTQAARAARARTADPSGAACADFAFAPVPRSRCTDPAALIAIAAACSKRPSAELGELLGAVLPLYVRALTGGRYSQLRELEGSWCAERLEPRADLPLASLSPPLRARLQLALQLALLEVLAPGSRTPVLVGPELGVGSDEDAQTLARALARLGSVRQVLHVCAEPGVFAESAHRVQRVSV